MTQDETGDQMRLARLFTFVARILGPERDFYWLAVIYGVGISVLSLATPISVQMLINTVANTGLATPLIVLSGTLFGLLMISGLLNALRLHLMEIFGRRFYARMVSEIALRAIYAQNPFFADERKSALFNRYHDIIIVQKNMPVLLIGGFTLLLQAGVGFVLVSLYHPLFFLFNTVVALGIWAIWLIWGPGAVRSAVDLSSEKHKAAAWLEGLGGSNGFFKSERHIAYALDATDKTTAAYIDQHRRHFRRHFSQTLSFLFIYAAASAFLLGLGGWLVIQGELTLGQLVAAELVLSAAFFGVSQLGTYLNYFYDLLAAIDKISVFFNIKQEEPTGAHRPAREAAGLAFAGAQGDARGRTARLDFEVPGGATVMAAAANHGVQRLMTNLIKRHVDPLAGYVAFGGVDILDADSHALRQEIIVIDRPTIVEMSIRDYLRINSDENSPSHALEALKIVGLETMISSLEDGLDTEVAATGWPLSIAETMQLKLAAAILERPRLLILNQLFDLIAEDCLRRALDHLKKDPGLTVIYFTNRRIDLDADLYLYLDYDRQHTFVSYEDFHASAHAGADALNERPRGAPRAPVALIAKD